MSIALNFIEIALSDARAALILYDKKLYPQSYFLFQQASEKATKAYGLFAGLIQEHELKKGIQHNQLKVYRKAIVGELTEMKSFAEQVKNRPEIGSHEFLKSKADQFRAHSERLQEGLKFHNSSKEMDLLNYSHEELDYYLDAMEEIVDFRIRKLNKKAQEAFAHEFKKYKDFGNSFFSEKDRDELNEALKEENKQVFQDIILQTSNYQFKLIFIHITFYFCSLVTIRHSNISRYPDNGINPLQFYNLNNPSVEYQPHFIRYLKTALSRLKKIVLLTEKAKSEIKNESATGK